MRNSEYMNTLYHDLGSNSPQTVSIDIPDSMGRGRISQTTTKQGVVFSDWEMNYYTDMNVQGTNSEEYIQLMFCLNEGVSWSIANEHQGVSIKKGESCIYRGHGKTEYLCYRKDADFRFKNIKLPVSYFEHVKFGYTTPPAAPGQEPVCKEIIHDVSFIARAGQKTALVGESGSGKSTLAKLLIHYYDAASGRIFLGGQDVQNMSLAALNDQISYVAQDQYLFNTSILENIRLGKPDATDAEVLEAAKKAQCLEFIEKLPQGIHSMAGDAGKMLSGGQRQRISLARAILKNAPVVVLDEATAFADPENEEKMEAAISELVKEKTLFVIAHKLPSIMHADQILVMDQGNLVAAGTHDTLLQSCPAYQKLWNAHTNSAEWKVGAEQEGRR